MVFLKDLYYLSYFKNECSFCKKIINEKKNDIYMYKYVFSFLL